LLQTCFTKSIPVTNGICAIPINLSFIQGAPVGEETWRS
jgi:hypothetical protein